MNVENWLYRNLGGEWCGNVCPPGDNENIRWVDNGCERVACILNDGFEIGIGSPSKWFVLIRRENALRLAWFILWTWMIRWEWFGLRRKLWYWLLFRRCNQSNALAAKFREAATPADPPKDR